MTIVHNRDVDFYKSYVVTPDFMARIVKICEEHTNDKPKMIVRFTNRIKLESTDLQSLLKDQNFELYSIKSIEISAFGRHNDIRHYITIEINMAENYLPVFRVKISGSHDKLVVAENKLMSAIGSIKTWYTPLSFSHEPRRAGLAYGAVAGLAGSAYTIDNKHDFISFEFAMAAILGATIAYIIGFGWTSLFPRITIDFGKGRNKIKLLNFLRNFIFITILVGLILGVLVNYIS